MTAALAALGLILLFLIVSAVLRGRREAEAARRRAEAERAARERGELPGAGAGGSPFGMFPFGGIFGQLMSGPGGWSRSYTFDDRTGEWVEMSDEPAPPQGEANGDTATAAPGAERRQETARPRPRPRTAPQNPLSSLFGGIGGGMEGSGPDVEGPDELPDFSDVGGMESLKTEIDDTVGLMLEHPDDAERYGIEWNGILLHGPPGVGKTFVAQAIAGQYGMNFIHVSTGDLVAGIVGKSAQNIEKAFETAARHLPCLLFFDEFDSVAQRRDQHPDQEARRTVNQLLTSLEAHRGERQLLVMAATNSIEHLDPAVIRPGRFDRHIRIDLPDADARREILRVELEERPVTEAIDLEDLVRRTEGMTPAAIEKVVEIAAMAVFRRATETGEQLQLDEATLLAAIERHGG